MSVAGWPSGYPTRASVQSPSTTLPTSRMRAPGTPMTTMWLRRRRCGLRRPVDWPGWGGRARPRGADPRLRFALRIRGLRCSHPVGRVRASPTAPAPCLDRGGRACASRGRSPGPLTTGDVGSVVARFLGSRWHLYTLPEYLFFYTGKSLPVLLEAHGFRVFQLRAEAAVYTVGYLVERLRKTLLGRSAERAAATGLGPGCACRPVLSLS